MNVLILAKEYHAQGSARAIQMRRVISGMIAYSDFCITLVTEGNVNQNVNTDRFKIINIPVQKKRFPLIDKLFDRLICSSYCLKDNIFIKSANQIFADLILSNQIDVLFTVSTPFDSHIAGLRIKNQNPKLKWVVFFSDLWPTVTLPKPYQRKKILSVLEMQLMKQITSKSNKILTPSKYSFDTLMKCFGISNEIYQIQHLAESSLLGNTDLLTGYIVHAGFLTKERIKDDLVIAVNMLAKKNPDFKGLIHIGNYHPKLKFLIEKYNCRNIFLMGSLPEELTAKIQQMVGVSLIIEAPMGISSPFMPSKITDSISNSAKVISISPVESFLSDFALEYQGIFCCTYESSAIVNCMLEAINSKEKINSQTLEYFHPRTVVNKYIEVFKK